MSEQFTAFKIKFPKEKASQFRKILDEANGEISEDNLFSYYGQLGDGVEAHLRSRAESSADWVDDELTVCEALIPYEFQSKGQSATIEFMTHDSDKIEEFADVMINTFELAGIEVRQAWIYSEDDLEDKEYLDLDPQDEPEFELEGGDLYCAVVHVRFEAERAAELTNLIWKSSKDETGPYAYHEELRNTEIDIFNVYDQINPALGNRFRALATTTPTWKGKDTTVNDTLHFVQASTVGANVSAIMWLLDDADKAQLFKDEVTRIFMDEGLEVVPDETALANQTRIEFLREFLGAFGAFRIEIHEQAESHIAGTSILGIYPQGKAVPDDVKQDFIWYEKDGPSDDVHELAKMLHLQQLLSDSKIRVDSDKLRSLYERFTGSSCSKKEFMLTLEALLSIRVQMTDSGENSGIYSIET